MTLALLLRLLACGETVAPAIPPLESGPEPAARPSPVSLYDACKEEVEGPTEAGECSADDQCATSGCSNEICVTTAVAEAGVMGVCMARDCHAVLDHCGCVEGRCRWSLK